MKIYGAWFYKVSNPEEEIKKTSPVPRKNWELIGMLKGKYQVPPVSPFLRKEANICLLGQGDKFKVFKI